jgi:flagellar motility protein MotE (MotC chaperone)
MIAKLQNPVLSAAVGLMLSVALGLSLSWRTLNSIADHALATRAHKEPSEMKKKGWDFWTIEIENLQNELKEERQRLRKQADTLDQRQARIVEEEKELAKLRGDIEGMRKEIADRVVEIKADESVNVRKLSQDYANLSPRQAVAIIREMDDNTAVKILSLMKPDVIGPIFEEMSKTAGTDGPLARRVALLTEKLRLMKVNKATPSP